MIGAFSKSLAQLADPALRRLLILSLALAVGCFAALLAGLFLALPWLLAFLPQSAPAWFADIAGILSGAGAALLAIVLFPGCVVAIQSAFLADPVCAAVERRHYPGLPPPRASGIGEQVVLALRQIGTTLGLNLLVLPLYFVPVVNVVAFAAVNGWLLARETFLAVALRRLDRAAAARLWRAGRARYWAAGAILALLMGIPVLNLAGALLGAAVMTHLVEAARRGA
jgi:uncharacterized protein involved in cysteine biosynthesis